MQKRCARKTYEVGVFVFANYGYPKAVVVVLGQNNQNQEKKKGRNHQNIISFFMLYTPATTNNMNPFYSKQNNIILFCRNPSTTTTIIATTAATGTVGQQERIAKWSTPTTTIITVRIEQANLDPGQGYYQPRRRQRHHQRLP